jgi:hypothetical protein
MYRWLLVAYPRSLRREFGDEMAALVGDRRMIDGEPLWRLWPSLLNDTAQAAVVSRWENLMSTRRALVLGLLATIAVLAILSNGPVQATPVLLVVAVLALIVTRQRRSVPTRARRSWLKWFVPGIVLVVTGFGYAALQGGDELSELEWFVFFFGSLTGIFATATGLIVLVGDRRRSVSA